MQVLMHVFKRFRRSTSANVSMVVALAAVPLLAISGLGLDYGARQSYKARLDAAADAAALAAIQTAQSDIMGNATTTAAISDGTASALKSFNTNAGAAASVLSQTVSISLVRSGQTLTATASYRGNSPLNFGRMFGLSSFPFAGSASATLTMGQYLNFYLLLDVSGSMGIPSTTSGQNRLAAINPDFLNLYPGGCTLACHFTAYQACQNKYGQTTTCQGYNLTRTNGTASTPVTFCPQPDMSNCIQLRLDAVAYAVQQLLTTAQQTMTLPNQYGVGLYPFIRWMQSYQPLSTNLTTVSNSAANLATLLDNGNGAGALGSGGTHFENALTSMNATITSVGDGSSAASPKPFVFLVTDGAQDNQIQSGGGSWSGSNSATTMDTSNCTTLKNRGITVAVLYVPYVAIPNPTTIWGNEDGYANANIPYIPGTLQTCASPGFYFTANSPTDITNAMQTMFAQSIQAARLSQ